ncbi:MAG TPA: hypothetical protein VF708_17965 [Pyrinomonadaceae bacterium]|jgi:hypothetical protein
MTTQALEAPRFIRKTQLAPSEYRKNFHQLDRDIILAITSPEADRITPLMSKIYLRLTTAPADYWEREGVLRFEAEWREGKHVKAWSVLCEVLGVASATASKALAWMHDVGVIGYFSGKNGVGIRIFLNRAANSIGSRAAQVSKKILPFSPASSLNSPASPNEAAFNDSFAVLEVLDSDFNSRKPDGCADNQLLDKKSPEPYCTSVGDARKSNPHTDREADVAGAHAASMVAVDEIVRRLKSELEPSLQTAARQAAAREHERTREWLETRGLPKAARVAQREAYNVLRSHGVINASKERTLIELEVGRSHQTVEARPLTTEEIKELAEMCIALLEMHGQAIDVTLSEISSEAGGCLLAEDAPRVRALAESMVHQIAQKDE